MKYKFFLIWMSFGILFFSWANSDMVEAGWEWQNPLPQGNPLRAVWGSSANNVSGLCT